MGDMLKLLEEVRGTVRNEYDRASAQYGTKHNSLHEGYAVLLEEYEEAMEQAAAFEEELKAFWNDVRNDDKNVSGRLARMSHIAERAAAEWVQAAAMCYKARL